MYVPRPPHNHQFHQLINRTNTAPQTGDEASMDEEGYVSITGRIKDLIIRGGENIHPLEVENCLFAHDEISEVSVVGLPNEKYGEVVAAFVVPRGGVGSHVVTIEEIRSWVREKLSHHLGELEQCSTFSLLIISPDHRTAVPYCTERASIRRTAYDFFFFPFPSRYPWTIRSGIRSNRSNTPVPGRLCACVCSKGA